MGTWVRISEVFRYSHEGQTNSPERSGCAIGIIAPKMTLSGNRRCPMRRTMCAAMGRTAFTIQRRELHHSGAGLSLSCRIGPTDRHAVTSPFLRLCNRRGEPTTSTVSGYLSAALGHTAAPRLCHRGADLRSLRSQRRLMALIDKDVAIQKILAHLGLATHPPAA